MKSIAILLCVLTVTACSAANDWEEFKNSFGKSYDDPEEEKYRKSVFEDNQKTVKEHNDRFEQGLETFDLQINEFGDLTNEEFKSNMNGLKVPTSDATRSRVYHPSNRPITSTVDWRSKGAITEVKNQGQCGSCWAFSTTGSVEAHHFLKTGKLVSLSEQNLMDCSQDFGNLGCMGGLMDNAFKYIKHNKGVDTEASYPYEAKNGKCRFNATNVGATDEGYVAIPIFNETALTIAVHDVGPVSVGIDAAGPLFQHYKSGVFYNKNCSDSALDHGVLVVGYGTDSGSDYYIVKNSWGPTWGQEGYIWMSRNKDNNCGIATWASYPIV